MAAAVKWIKICTDIFDDEKILLIESMPDADSIIVVWFKLLCFAGKQNNDGIFVFDEGFPYTVPMLSTIFHRKEATVELALKTFETFKMIEITDGIISISNWQKYQNTERLRKIREDTRQRNIRYRERKKALAEHRETECDASRDAFVTNEEVRSKNKTKNNISTTYLSANADGKSHPKADYAHVVDLFNRVCTSLPKVKSVTDKRKKAIKAAQQTVDEFGGWEKLFETVEQSDFLSGRSGAWSGCGFDWILKPANLTKIIEGNYSNGRNAKTSKTPDFRDPNNYEEKNVNYDEIFRTV